MSTRLLLFVVVAFALLWALPPRSRRRRGRRKKRRVDLESLRKSLAYGGGSESREQYRIAVEKVEAGEWIDISARQGRRRRATNVRALVIFGVSFIILVGVILFAVGIEPFSTYTDRYLPFAKAQEPAPRPALAVAVATVTASTTTATPPNPTSTPFVAKTVPLPVVTPAPASTSVPLTSTPTPDTPTPSDTPKPRRRQAASAFWTPTPIPSPSPIPTPHPVPSVRHTELKNAMLDLVNAERKQAGVQPVVLGNNPAAQLHAEQSLASCTATHWDMYGTKPYMRYSLVGGYQDNSENAHGTDGCPRPGVNYEPVKPAESVVRAVKGWMNSPGHRKTILHPTFKKLNVGLAWSGSLFYAFQHFEGDYVEFDALPTITFQGVLHFAGRTKNGAYLVNEDDMFVAIDYDSPLQNLTYGQLVNSGCYANGVRVASLRRPLTDGSQWTSDWHGYELTDCVDPYDIDTENQEMPERKPQTVSVPWITAAVWDCAKESFEVSADISDVLDKHGDGIYTVRINATIDGKHEWIAEYSIFRGVEAPAVYQGYSGN